MLQGGRLGPSTLADVTALGARASGSSRLSMNTASMQKQQVRLTMPWHSPGGLVTRCTGSTFAGHQHFLRHVSLAAAGVAGAVSRTATAPVDRLKMLMQIADGGARLTLRQAFQQMAAEGEQLWVVVPANTLNVAVTMLRDDTFQHRWPPKASFPDAGQF